MATIIVLSAVVKRLRDNFHTQFSPEDLQSLGNLGRLLENEAIYKHVRDENFAERVRQLEKTLYSIEDLVESHEVGVPSKNKVGIFKRMSRRTASPKTQAELTTLTHQIKDSLAFLENHSAGEPSQGSSSTKDKVGGPDLPRTSTLAGEQWDGRQIIRMEHEENLVLALTGLSRRVEVVSICGIAGIGKTTLARTLYNNTEVMEAFTVRAWITITQKFRTRDIFLSICRQIKLLDSDLLASKDDMYLAEAIYRCLKGWRWLVVLDDVWDIDVWDSIKLIFPDDRNGSRILVTTRNGDVALSMSRGGPMHRMDFLNEDQSWELFKRRAQLTDSELDSEQEEIAKKIARQGGGLPSAIVVLANILKTKSFDEWNSLLRDNAVEISKTHASEALGHPLDLSYNTLPSALKPCLLYMGTFPEGSKIEADTMSQLWIAEGLASTMERAGNYFDELASRNLVQLPEEDMSTHKSFRYGCLHGLVRDTCVLKAKEEEFFEIGKLGRADQPEDSVFRRAIYLDKHEKMDMHPCLGSNLRSLLFFNSSHQSGNVAIPDLSDLKWIRILHFEGVDFREGTLPSGVENLVLLRYLSLRNCYLEELPPYISKFIFLITLDIRVKKRCKVIIPDVLCKLQKLKHLYLPLKFQTPDHNKLQLNGLEDLEILENFDAGICNADDIVKLTKLRHLAVSSEGNLKDLEQIFECIKLNKNHLSKTSLDIRNFDCYSDERLLFIKKLFSCRAIHVLRLEGHIGKMPELDAISASFTEIHLNGSQLEDDPMQTLEELPNLRILVLKCDAYTGNKMHCSEFGFSELISLKLSTLYNLESWEVEEGAMPKLSTLTIENCRKMEKLIPEQMGYLKVLRKLKIKMMSKNFVVRLRNVDGKGGEDLYKINTNCTIEFGSDNLWSESTDSTTERSLESKMAECQIPSSTSRFSQ